MRRKIASVLTSLLILTLALTAPYYVQKLAADIPPPPPPPGGIFHWKIVLAQKDCNAKIVGNLSDPAGHPIPGTNFTLICNCSGFVFAKVKNETANVHDINFTKWIDWDKDGKWDVVAEPINGILRRPTHRELGNLTWYQHEQTKGTKMVVVEVHEQLWNPNLPHFKPYFEWQVTLIAKRGRQAVTANFSGFLTKNCTPILGTDFKVSTDVTVVPVGIPGGIVNFTLPRRIHCDVVRTPWCTVPNDINYTLLIDWNNDDVWDSPFNDPTNYTKEWITQFPWVKKINGTDYGYPGCVVEIELTEVVMHRSITMVGMEEDASDLGDYPVTRFGDWKIGQGSPFCTRAPYVNPGQWHNNITTTQRDPITGIVRLSLLKEDYGATNHTHWSDDLDTYLKSYFTTLEQGFGWYFTGQGKAPVPGDVDIVTFANNTGNYFYGPDRRHSSTPNDGTWNDDVFVENWSLPIPPLLQGLTGPDGVPGTHDGTPDNPDPWGDGTPDDPGSGILIISGRATTSYWLNPNDITTEKIMFSAPFPVVMTTGNASGIIIEPASDINGFNMSVIGHPGEFLNSSGLLAEHPYNDAWSKYVFVWSELEIPTPLGILDFMTYSTAYSVPEYCVIADIDENQICDIFDLVKIGLAYNAKDEGWGRPNADPNYNGRADLKPEKGLIDIFDLVICGIDYNSKLTEQGIIRPY